MMKDGDDVKVPDDAGEYAEGLAAILRRIPRHWGRSLRCDAGWYGIITRLDAELYALVGEYEINQVKEKFGGLRYYCEYPDGTSRHVAERCDALIRAAEAQSFETCEKCGASGKLRTSSYYLVTLCDDHERARYTGQAGE
ncbi:hypothetical protein [Demequina iriomotensis]|uniref:hypothetical protein n=1 Tax=Demequina iriomotensis TaxID=1536641 RepID=UPI00078124DE|nr:hypothetical protein [Demequina iriomotensis]